MKCRANGSSTFMTEMPNGINCRARALGIRTAGTVVAGIDDCCRAACRPPLMATGRRHRGDQRNNTCAGSGPCIAAAPALSPVLLLLSIAALSLLGLLQLRRRLR